MDLHTSDMLTRLTHVPRWMFQDVVERPRSSAVLSIQVGKATAGNLLPLIDDPTSLPVLLVTEDYGVPGGMRMCSALCEDLASRGYIVVSMQHDAASTLHFDPFYPTNRPSRIAKNNGGVCDVVQKVKNDEDDVAMEENEMVDMDIGTEDMDDQRQFASSPHPPEQQDALRQALAETIELRSREVEFVMDRLMMINYGETPSDSAGLHVIDGDSDGEEETDAEAAALVELFKGRLNLEQVAIIGRMLRGEDVRSIIDGF